MENVYTGNANLDGPKDHGWLLGWFKPESDVRRSEGFEVKWGRHLAGDRRTEWVSDDERLTTMILVSGRFVVEFEDREAVLAQPGDYVVWAGVDHSWRAAEDTVIVTVRGPSIPGYKAAGAAEDLP